MPSYFDNSEYLKSLMSEKSTKNGNLIFYLVMGLVVSTSISVVCLVKMQEYKSELARLKNNKGLK